MGVGRHGKMFAWLLLVMLCSVHGGRSMAGIGATVVRAVMMSMGENLQKIKWGVGMLQRCGHNVKADGACHEKG